MRLLDYFKSLSADEQLAFAKKAGTSIGYLQQAAYGYKNIGPDFALRLEQASDRNLIARELCPDFNWDLAKESLCSCESTN